MKFISIGKLFLWTRKAKGCGDWTDGRIFGIEYFEEWEFWFSIGGGKVKGLK